MPSRHYFWNKRFTHNHSISQYVSILYVIIIPSRKLRVRSSTYIYMYVYLAHMCVYICAVIRAKRDGGPWVTLVRGHGSLSPASAVPLGAHVLRDTAIYAVASAAVQCRADWRVGALAHDRVPDYSYTRVIRIDDTLPRHLSRTCRDAPRDILLLLLRTRRSDRACSKFPPDRVRRSRGSAG